VVAGLSPRKREAFFLWAMGYTEAEAAKKVGYNQSTVSRIIKHCIKSL